MRLDNGLVQADLGYYSSDDCRMSGNRRRPHSTSRATTINTSAYNFASLASSALHASSQSLDYPGSNYNNYPPVPQHATPPYPRSPVHQRYNQHYAAPAAPSPPPSGGYYSPSPKRHGAANFYWTARVCFNFCKF